MTAADHPLTSKLEGFGTTIFATMSALATQTGSINLGQGFPDTDGPAEVLDAAVEAGLDVPFACKAGVCCTCRAKVMQGSAQMDKNFTLTTAECDQGFVLTCQARPTSADLVLSFDER